MTIMMMMTIENTRCCCWWIFIYGGRAHTLSEKNFQWSPRELFVSSNCFCYDFVSTAASNCCDYILLLSFRCHLMWLQVASARQSIFGGQFRVYRAAPAPPLPPIYSPRKMAPNRNCDLARISRVPPVITHNLVSCAFLEAMIQYKQTNVHELQLYGGHGVVELILRTSDLQPVNCLFAHYFYRRYIYKCTYTCSHMCCIVYAGLGTCGVL